MSKTRTNREEMQSGRFDHFLDVLSSERFAPEITVVINCIVVNGLVSYFVVGRMVSNVCIRKLEKTCADRKLLKANRLEVGCRRGCITLYTTHLADRRVKVTLTIT